MNCIKIDLKRFVLWKHQYSTRTMDSRVGFVDKGTSAPSTSSHRKKKLLLSSHSGKSIPPPPLWIPSPPLIDTPYL